MNINLHCLKATGKLNPYLQDIEKFFNEAITKITKALPVDNVDIVVVDDEMYAIPEIGFGGHTYNPNYIVVSVNPTFANFHATLQVELLDTLAHELHHAARWQAIGYGDTLLEAMVSEGLADHFAIEITERKDIHPWDRALKNKQIKMLLEKAQKSYDDKNYDHNAWFFGSKEMDIPKWTGYALGFETIKKYLQNNPDKKASSLYDTHAKDFVA